MLDMEEAEQIEGDIDPADRALIAHETAAAMVAQAREAKDPELVARLVRLVDEEGIDTVAMLWSKAEPHTLPGALWRLFLVFTRLGAGGTPALPAPLLLSWQENKLTQKQPTKRGHTTL